MDNTKIREQLHHLIDVADNSKLEAMYSFFREELGDDRYTTEELAEFHHRLEKYQKGQMPGYSVEDAHNFVRNHKQR